MMKTVLLLAALLSIGVAYGDNVAGDETDFGVADTTSPALTMSATANNVHLENHGSAPAYIGGLEIRSGNTIIGRVPKGVVLKENPFKYVRDDLSGYFIDISVSASPGEVLRLSTTMGTIIQCVVK